MLKYIALINLVVNTFSGMFFYGRFYFRFTKVHNPVDEAGFFAQSENSNIL